MDTLPEAQIQTWLDLRGPARRALLDPLARELVHRPPPPPDHLDMVEPARWLLTRAGGKGLPLDGEGSLRHRFAVWANAELGYPSPAFTPKGGETFLEVDMLFTWLRALDTTIRVRSKEFLSHLGNEYINDPVALWYSLASCLGMARPKGFHGELWELVLAWVVRDELGDEELGPPVDEAAAANGLDHEAESFTGHLEIGFFSLYTGLRTLRAFVPKDPDDPAKPRLTAAGRLAAIEALRACVATCELIGAE